MKTATMEEIEVKKSIASFYQIEVKIDKNLGIEFITILQCLIDFVFIFFS